MASKNIHKQRTYLDPIHGPIHLSLSNPVERLLVKIIDTKEFQRLRRVHQMGLGWFTFHGAEHSRFGHSLGTLFIARKMIESLSKKTSGINVFKPEFLTAALLHDVGHGPFSHTSEKLIPISHEELTKNIIENDSEINIHLKKFQKDLPEKIIDLLSHKTKHKYLSQLVSSYIDCDRLDYLHRDSYYIGVPYGLTGSDRIISSLEIDKNTKHLVVLENLGLDAVIHYLHARYSMYQQIYQHKKNIASDFMLRKIIGRIIDITPTDTPVELKKWFDLKNKTTNKIDLEFYSHVDDYSLLTYIHSLAYKSFEDKLLKDLCRKFISRKLFKSIEFRAGIKQEKIQEIIRSIKKLSKNKNLAPDYYAGIELSSSKPYEPYKAGDKTGKAIFIKQNNGLIKELSKVSGLVKALSQENIVKTCLVFAPELEDEIFTIKGFKEIFK